MCYVVGTWRRYKKELGDWNMGGRNIGIPATERRHKLQTARRRPRAIAMRPFGRRSGDGNAASFAWELNQRSERRQYAGSHRRFSPGSYYQQSSVELAFLFALPAITVAESGADTRGGNVGSAIGILVPRALPTKRGQCHPNADHKVSAFTDATRTHFEQSP
jgi:hypothetical protein